MGSAKSYEELMVQGLGYSYTGLLKGYMHLWLIDGYCWMDFVCCS